MENISEMPSVTVKRIKQFMIANRQLLVFPMIALLWNGIVYSGGRALASGQVRYDMTLGEFICFAFFVLLPTTNIRPAVPGDDIWSWIVRIQYHFDEANNLFPSIHCMVSWLCWIGLRKQTKSCPRWFRRSSFAVALAVCISTLTLKQHVIADVIGAIIVAEIPMLLNRYIRLIEIVLQQPIRQLDLYKYTHKGGTHEVSTRMET